MRKVGIIPARYGSTRFPGKPLADIDGKPMIRRVYERSAKASALDRIVVATDDPRISQVVEGFGGSSVLTRPNHPSGTDRIAEACELLGLDDDDVIVNIQGDEPLVEPVMVTSLIEALIAAPQCAMATLAFESRDESDYSNPNVVKTVVDRRGNALYFSRSPLPFHRDGATDSFSFLKHLGFYAYRLSFLRKFTKLAPGKLEQIEKLEQLRALEHGYSIRVAPSPVDTFGVDTPEDIERVRRVLGY